MALRVDVSKLCITIDVLGTFSRLAVRLQAIAHVAQKLADDRRGDLVALGGQRVYQITQTALSTTEVASDRPASWVRPTS